MCVSFPLFIIFEVHFILVRQTPLWERMSSLLAPGC